MKGKFWQIYQLRINLSLIIYALSFIQRPAADLSTDSFTVILPVLFRLPVFQPAGKKDQTGPGSRCRETVMAKI